MASDYLTAAELTRRLRLSVETVRQMTRDGRIPCIRISPKVIRLDAEAVAIALAERQVRHAH